MAYPGATGDPPDKAAACRKDLKMERIVDVHIENLPEGMCLAISDDMSGLVAQGRTVAETLEIARDVVSKLLAARAERQGGRRWAKREMLRLRADRRVLIGAQVGRRSTRERGQLNNGAEEVALVGTRS